MAFLCPARKQRKRSKVKIKGSKPLDVPLMGRITGSDSIDTIERVAIEKERGNHARMVVLHNFEPCVDDELRVQRGEEVKVLYQENDWLYVITEDNREGFIPYTYGLPVQRSVDDFVQSPGNGQSISRSGSRVSGAKQRPSSAHITSEETKPAYQVTAIKSQSALNRSSSKSLPDMSDLAGPPTGKALDGNQRYPKDGTQSTKSSFKNQSNGEGLKDLTYGMNRDFMDAKTLSRPRSLSYETQGRKLPQYNRSAGGMHSQPTTPVKTTENSRNSYSFKSNSLSQSQPVTVSNHGYHYAPGVYSSARLSRRDQEDLDYVNSLRRKDREEALRRPLHQSWGPGSGQKLAQLLQSSRNLSSHHHVSLNQTNASHQGLLQVTPHMSAGNSVTRSSFLSTTNRNRTPLSSSSLFREESAKLSSFTGSNSHKLIQGDRSQSNGSVTGKPRIEKFSKTTHGEYLVLYEFTAQQENDLGVGRGEFVSVLNTEDKNWYWVRRSDHREGFVPSNYLLNIDGQIQSSPVTNPTVTSGSNPQTISNSQPTSTARQSQWTTSANQQPKPLQPAAINHSNSYQPAANTRHLASHQHGPSVLSLNKQPLNSTIYHSSTSNTTPNRQPSITSSTNNHQAAVAATSSPRETQKVSTFQQQLSPIPAPNNLSPSIPIGSTRLICLYDYSANAPDDLTVSRGQWLYADSTQDDPDWLWVYSPSQSKAGYIPRTYAKPPSSW